MEGSTHSKPPKAKIFTLLLLTVLWTRGGASLGASPHQVYNMSWIITNLETGWSQVLANGKHAEGTWWPPLTFDLCQLAKDSWEHTERTPHNSYPPCRHSDWYTCPGGKRTRECGGPETFYCAKWGCETYTLGWLGTNKGDLVAFSPETPGDSRIKIEFTDQGKNIDWKVGRRWGIRLYTPGQTNPGLLFSLQLVRERVTQEIGPNPVLMDQKPPSRPAPALPPVGPPLWLNTTQNSGDILTTPSPTRDPSTPAPQLLGTGDRLINLVTGAYLALNYSEPDKTQECWLCLVSSPPYYEGVAVMGNYTNQTTAPASCTTLPSHRLTLPEVSGQGLCIGTIPPTHQVLCTITERIPTGSYYLAAPTGTYWACNTGLTPCISAAILRRSSDYCVLVEIWPKVTYHGPEYIYSHFERLTRFRREPITMTLALLLGGITLGGMAAGIGTGTTALIETGHFRQLQAAMNADLKAIEESVSALEKSLTSLSEVVLQNRRGLDMLFLREGGLCAALKEECCFYADHTGLVRDNMAKLRERLAQRQKLFDSQQGWFEGWFNRSPWFATLVSTLMGPLIILLLILLFGPCILNRLMQFIKNRLSVIQTLVLTQQYQRVRQQEEIP
uniref:Envelope glycoprotein n=1 Tax=Recombinant M-MuLV/RaLV retrovirus TaxID=221982 RepID=Q7ZL00_9GAMR|nr:envelope glycoprotein [Recombinant M-MuLV/RaLV retrovirus]